MKVSNGIFFMNASLLGVLGLGACATVGENDFACPGRPSGVRCASALEVYRATEGTDVIAATAGEALGDDPDKAVRRLADETGEASNARVSSGASRDDTSDGQPRAVPTTLYAEADPRLHEFSSSAPAMRTRHAAAAKRRASGGGGL